MSVSFNPRVLIREVAPMPGPPIEPLPSASKELAQNIDFSKSLINSLEVEMERLQHEKLTTEQALKAALARKREALIASATGGTGDSVPQQFLLPNGQQQLSQGNQSGVRPSTTSSSAQGALTGAAKAAWEKAIVEDELSQPLKISTDQLLKLTEEEREAERRLQAELSTHMQQLKQLRHKITEREGAAAAQAMFGASVASQGSGLSPPRGASAAGAIGFGGSGVITAGAASILNNSGGMKSSASLVPSATSAFRPAGGGAVAGVSPQRGSDPLGASGAAPGNGAPATTTGAISRLEALEARIAQLEAGISGKEPLVVPMNALPPSRGAMTTRDGSTPGGGRRQQRAGVGVGDSSNNFDGASGGAYLDGGGSVTAAGLYFDQQQAPDSGRPSTSAATAGANGKRSIMKPSSQQQYNYLQQQQHPMHQQYGLDAGTGGPTTPLPYSTSSGLLASMNNGNNQRGHNAGGGNNASANPRSVSFATLSKEVPLSVALLSSGVGPLPQPKAAKMPPPVTRSIGGGTGPSALPAVASAPVMGLVFQRERVRPGPNQPLTTQYTVMRAPGSTELGLVDHSGSLASLQEYGRPPPKQYKSDHDFDDIGPSASQVLSGGGNGPYDLGDEGDANPTTNDAIDNWLESKQQGTAGSRKAAGGSRGAATAGRGGGGKRATSSNSGANSKFGPSPYASGSGNGNVGASAAIGIGSSGGAFKPVQQRAASSSSGGHQQPGHGPGVALIPPQQPGRGVVPPGSSGNGNGGFFMTGGDFGGPDEYYEQQPPQHQQPPPMSSASGNSPSRSPSRGRARTPPATRQPQMPIREAVARQKMELSMKPGAAFSANGPRYQPGAGAVLMQNKTSAVGRGGGNGGNQQATSSMRLGMRAAVKNATMAQFRELRDNFSKSKTAIWSPIRGSSSSSANNKGGSAAAGGNAPTVSAAGTRLGSWTYKRYWGWSWCWPKFIDAAAPQQHDRER